jgi:hypothetical protein
MASDALAAGHGDARMTVSEWYRNHTGLYREVESLCSLAAMAATMRDTQ